MKYLLVLSLVAFFIGCGDENTHQQTKAEVTKHEKQEAVTKPVVKEKKVQEVKKPTTSAQEVKQEITKVDGATLYKSCAGCHGVNAEKKALGKSEIIKGWSQAEVAKALEGYKKGTRNIHGMGGLMKAQASKLSQEQIKVLSEYISKF